MRSKFSLHNLKEIPEDKKLLFLAISLILTFILNNIANRGFSNLMNFVNQPVYPSTYSIGIFGILLIIPAALFSAWIVNSLDGLQHRLLNSRFADTLRPVSFWMKKNMGYKAKRKKSSAKRSRSSNTRQTTQQSALKSQEQTTHLMNEKELQTNRQWQAYIRQEEQHRQADMQRQDQIRKKEAELANQQRLEAEAQRRAQKLQQEADYANKQKLEAEARWQARKKQEEADFAKRRAIEQAQYKSKLILQEKINKANAMQREADKAQDRVKKF
ncbi:hypothetical protein [Planococcus sp. SSTMD024]|uniref:hypothetical protein n=1 Tax=Planococcus sp. SSTMD024 TaxID=3242163 RepID=UPI00351F2DE1